jgi:hypothetical protein
MDKQKINFSDLSAWLKTAVVMAWIVGFIYIIAFMVGFIGAMIGVE